MKTVTNSYLNKSGFLLRFKSGDLYFKGNRPRHSPCILKLQLA